MLTKKFWSKNMSDLVGIVLAGGLGTRNGWYTHRINNKHLLYVYNRSMMEYPILSLVEAGIKNCTIVTGGRFSGSTMDTFGNGNEFGLDSLNYGRQYGEGGIGAALKCAAPFAKGKPVCVILGDNLFEDDLSDFVQSYTGGCRILLKEVQDPRAYGVVTLDESGKITKIIEKPKQPESNFAVVGAYIFDKDVFDILDTLKPSARGEMEVTDIIDVYIKRKEIDYRKLNGYWIDMGSPDNLLEAANFIKANKEYFDKRFSKHFKIDLSLPLTRSKALEILNVLDKEYGSNIKYVKEFLEHHIRVLDKWGR